MVFAFDTLSYARFLRERGISQDHAEAYAEAARQFIMAELVTKQDLLAVRQDLQTVRQDLQEDLQAVRKDLQEGLQAVRKDLQKDLQNAITQFDSKLENLSLRQTVRLGALLVAG